MISPEAAAHSSSRSADWPGPQRVTRCFLFTDIENSTGIWERVGDAFHLAIELHHRTIADEIARHGGQELREAGDGFLVAFHDPRAAAGCAIEMQRALDRCEWPVETGPLRVRMGLHLGEVETRENGEYRGLTLHRGARVGSAAHGGQIVCSSTVAAALPPGDISELGVFRLKGVPMPERLFQVCWEGMPRREFPKPNAQPAFKTELPPAFTEFFGRQREIAEVRKLLLSSQKSGGVRGGARGGRLITLTGPGGTGKTRLSLAVAECVAAEYSHAVWFVPLADLAEARLIPATVRNALGIEGSADEEPMDQIVGALSGQPSLVVLDNFEHFTEDGAAFLQELLTRVPSLECLVTARQRVGLTGERTFSVPPLEVPRDDDPEAIRECESVLLFIDRAQAVNSAFGLTPRNAPAVAELCRRLEGVPLAIELAAARAHVLTPHEMLASLGKRLDIFATENFQVPARHRSLRAAIDWSYDYLPRPLQQMFARLSVFRGGWTAEAAAAVAAPEGLEDTAVSVVRALGELRAASLIRSEEAGEIMRFMMLETLRQYAAERLLASGEGEAVGVRHGEYFATLADRAGDAIHDCNQGRWLDELEREHDNLRAALAGGGALETRLRLAAALPYFWMLRGHMQEGQSVLTELATETRGAGGKPRASLCNAAGILAVFAADFARAREYFTEALAHFREMGEARNEAGMLNNLGIVAQRTRDYASCRAHYQEALAIYDRLAMEAQRAQVLCNLGGATSEQGDPAARGLLEEALKSLRRIGDEFGIASTLHNLALIDSRDERHAEAEERLRQSLAIRSKLDNQSHLPGTFIAMAIVAARAGKLGRAVCFATAAQALAEAFAVELPSAADFNQDELLQAAQRVLAPEFLLECRRKGEALGRDWARPREERGDETALDDRLPAS